MKRLPNIDLSIDNLELPKQPKKTKKQQQQEEYKKEVQRVKRKIVSLRKKGYTIDTDIIPKTLKGIKNLTNDKIIEKAFNKWNKGKRKQVFSSTNKQSGNKSLLHAEYRKELSKERSRIKRQLRSLQKRGYDVSNIQVPDTLEEAKDLTLDKIYKLAGYKTEDGEYIKGTERRKQERSESAKKAVETRRFRERLRNDPELAGTPRQPKQELPNIPRMEDIIIDNVLDLLQRLEYGDTSWRQTQSGKVFTSPPMLEQASETARQSLVQLLKDQIAEYGTNAVARHLEEQATHEDLVAIVNAILHGWYKDEYTSINMVQSNYQRLASMISGTILTEYQVKQWSNYDTLEEGFFIGD